MSEGDKARPFALLRRFHAIRPLFAPSDTLLGVLWALSVTFAQLFQEIPPRTPLSGRPKVTKVVKGREGRNQAYSQAGISPISNQAQNRAQSGIRTSLSALSALCPPAIRHFVTF